MTGLREALTALVEHIAEKHYEGSGGFWNAPEGHDPKYDMTPYATEDEKAEYRGYAHDLVRGFALEAHRSVVVDRDALVEVLRTHQMHYAYGTAAACACKWEPADSWVWQPEHRRHVADVIAGLVRSEAEVRAEEREQVAEAVLAWRPTPERDSEPGDWKRGVRHAKLRAARIARSGGSDGDV